MRILLPCICRNGLLLFVVFVLSLCLPVAGQAQGKLNYGLSMPQDAHTLPQSRAAYVAPVPKVKTAPVTYLQAAPNGALNLTQGWELTEAAKARADGGQISTAGYNSSKWYNATVPGTVLTTLVQQGVYPDPYFGLNNLHIPDSLCRKAWWYRIRFNAPKQAAGQLTWLNFEGINYAAEIWLNGHAVGKMKGAFKQQKFDVSTWLHQTGVNVLAVKIMPPPNPGIPHEESALAGTGPNGGTLCLDGPTFISSEGWDWVPGIRDRNIGIWQNVSLHFSRAVLIESSQVITDLPLPDTSSANIIVRTALVNTSGQTQRVVLHGNIGSVKFQQPVTLGPHQQKTISFDPSKYTQLHLNHPRLWWPNGYGNPALYTLSLTAMAANGMVSDGRSVRFGIRELSYELTVHSAAQANHKRIEFNPLQALAAKKPFFNTLKKAKAAHDVTVATIQPQVDASQLTTLTDTSASPYLVLRVNGQRIYCKGGNWGMDDAMKQVSHNHLEPYFKLHRDAHFNMIRNWTGESTEEAFYDLCDEYGMLVWNDFWLSTEGYNLNVKDEALFLANAEDVVKRFRNHPSIAIWCPRNEGYAPDGLETQLAALIAREDGTRYYQPNSRYMNLRTSGPWHYFRRPADYYKLASGFSTELGTPSIPTAASIRKMMAPEDQWPISDAWYYHDFHDGQKEFVASMDSLYGKATSLDDFCRKAQLLNYDSHRAMFEAWNSKLWNNTSGLLLWMTHPAWPSMVWQTYSWDYETFGAYFASMKACEPIHVQLNPLNNEVAVVNTSLQSVPKGNVELAIYGLDGKAIYSQSATVSISPNQLTHAFTAQLPNNLSGIYMVRIKLSDAKGVIISLNDYWKTLGDAASFQAFNQLPPAVLKWASTTTATAADDELTLTVMNTSAVPAIAVKIGLEDRQTRERILPAYFNEGCFNLLPGESRQVTVKFKAKNKQVRITASGYNVAAPEV